MGEVEHAHQAVDERQPGRDEEVHRGEPEAGDREEDERLHQAAAPETPRYRCTCAASSSKRSRRAGVDHATLVEHDRVPREAVDDVEVLLDEDDRCDLGRPLEHARDLRDEQRREPLRRLVDQQHAVVVQERARDRHHLLLTARERAGALLRALAQLGEELVHEVVASGAVSLRQLQVLAHGQAGEHVPVLRDVADAEADDLVRRHPGQLLLLEPRRPARLDQAEEGAERRRLADAVPAEQRGDAALRHRERDPLQDVRAREVHVQVRDLDQRPPAVLGHSGSPT